MSDIDDLIDKLSDINESINNGILIQSPDFNPFLELLNGINSLPEDQKDRAEVLKLKSDYYYLIGDYYREIGNYEDSLYYFQKSLKYVMNDDYPKENFVDRGGCLNSIGNVYFESKKYKDAMKYYVLANQELPNDILILNGISNAYLEMKKKNKAIETFEEILPLIKNKKKDEFDNLSEPALILKNYGIILFMKDREKALTLVKQSFDFYSDSRVNNPFDIKILLDELFDLDSKFTLDLAIQSIYGIIWLYSKIMERKIDNLEIIGFWDKMKDGSISFWNLMEQQKSDYSDNWKIKQILEEIKSNLSQEYLLNYLLGLNEINEKEKVGKRTWNIFRWIFNRDEGDSKWDLRDEEEEIPSKWFIEFPRFILHEQDYLKIRVNNLIKINEKNNGFLVLNSDNIPEYYPIERVRFKIETNWLKTYEFDNKFKPNTQNEFESSKKDELVWLKDVFSINLEENQKKKKNLEFKVFAEVYLKSHSKPIEISTNYFSIPIIRRNKIQDIDRIIRNNNNLLTIIFALSTLLFSIVSNIVFNTDKIYSISNVLFNKTDLPILEISSLILIIVVTPFIYYLVRNSGKSLIKKINDFSISEND